MKRGIRGCSFSSERFRGYLGEATGDLHTGVNPSRLAPTFPHSPEGGQAFTDIAQTVFSSGA